MKIIITANTSWNLYNFRLGIIRAMLEKGYEVIAVAPRDDYSKYLIDLGCRHIHLTIDSKSKSVLEGLKLLYEYRRIIKSQNPDCLLSFTAKPNIFASFASIFTGVRLINNIAGLGSSFDSASKIKFLLYILYKFALRKSKMVFFQNNEDLNYFLKNKIVDSNQSMRLPGSGVNTEYFNNKKFDKKNKCFTFIMISRLLWTKGVNEYVKSAEIIKTTFSNVEFKLVGFIDNGNPSSLNEHDLEMLNKNHNIQYLGKSDNVKTILASVDCVVLPTFYNEGVPHILIQSASMSIPIITTNTPGCRDIVNDGINGYLCKPENISSLVEAMSKMLNLHNEDRKKMSINSRQIAETKFNENIIISKYLSLIDNQTE